MVAAAVPDAVGLTTTVPRQRGSKRPEPLEAPPVFVEMEPTGLIRTSDPLFTNQPAIEFSSRFWLSMYSQGFH